MININKIRRRLKSGGYLTGKGQKKSTNGQKGGIAVGDKHSAPSGGISAEVGTDRKPIKFEGGEVVITAPAVDDNTKREFEGQMLTNRQILSKINHDAGGVSFADGGKIPRKIKYYKNKKYKVGGKLMNANEVIEYCGCGCEHKKVENGGYIYDIPIELREMIEAKSIKIINAKKIKDADDEGDGETWEIVEERTLYEVRQDYDGNMGDPISNEKFDTLKKAQNELDSLEKPESWETRTTDHYAFIEKVIQKRTINYEFYSSWDNYNNIKWEYEDSEDMGYRKSFGSREEDSQELLHRCHYELSGDVSGEYKADGNKIIIVGLQRKQYTPKYSSLWIKDTNENEIGRIELRIADHSYNPKNRSNLEDGFISVVIANEDETKSKFSGIHNLYFEGDADYNDVVESVKEKIQDILDGLDIEERIKKNNDGFSKGGYISFDDKVKAISKSLVGTKVPAKYRSEYGKRYTQKTADIAAHKIAGAIVQNEMAKGGYVSFDDKVKAISKNLIGTEVPLHYQPEYGKMYTKKTATISARKIAGAMERNKKMNQGGLVDNKALEQAKQVLKNTKLDALYQAMVDVDPVAVIKFIAEQAQGITDAPMILSRSESYQSSVSLFGKDLVDLSIQAYPKKLSEGDILKPEEEKELAEKYRMIQELEPIEIADIEIKKILAEAIYKKLPATKNDYDNNEIKFVKSIFGKFAGDRNRGLIYKAMPYLTLIIRHAIPIYITKNHSDKHRNIISFHNYLSKFRIADQQYAVRITAYELKEAIDKKKHHLHDLFISNIEIIKGEQLEDTRSLYRGLGPSTDTKLQNWLQKAKEASLKYAEGGELEINKINPIIDEIDQHIVAQQQKKEEIKKVALLSAQNILMLYHSKTAEVIRLLAGIKEYEKAIKAYQEELLSVTEQYNSNAEELQKRLNNLKQDMLSRNRNYSYDESEFKSMSQDQLCEHTQQAIDLLKKLNGREGWMWGMTYYAQVSYINTFQSFIESCKELDAVKENILKPMGISINDINITGSNYKLIMQNIEQEIEQAEKNKKDLQHKHIVLENMGIELDDIVPEGTEQRLSQILN